MIAALRQPRPGIPEVSEVDHTVVALAIVQQATLLSDDGSLRLLAEAQGLPVIGSVGVLVHARLDGAIPALKPLLDRLVAAGFHLNPQGPVYRDALRKVREVES
jgi:predicted nucleic acid-binding protein